MLSMLLLWRMRILGCQDMNQLSVTDEHVLMPQMSLLGTKEVASSKGFLVLQG